MFISRLYKIVIILQHIPRQGDSNKTANRMINS